MDMPNNQEVVQIFVTQLIFPGLIKGLCEVVDMVVLFEFELFELTR